jgi:biotin carboxyl carrier protein
LEKLVMNSTSKRKLKVTVNGKPYVVEVGSLAESPIHVTVNGQPYVVEISTGEVTKVPKGESATALDSAVRTVAPPSAPAPTSPAAAGANAITAPMPGQIVDVFVKQGDQVNAGQEVCSLEAMKMKNAIRSPRAGVVADVAASPGQKVAHGQVLVTFE